MPTKTIRERLDAGELLIMDGGTGSELQARGADVLVGATVDTGLQAWSATANVEHADVVQQVHQDYLRVGADILISNNFWTSPSRMEPIGLKGDWSKYARASVENAIRARDALNPEAYVTGGMAPPCLTYSEDASDVVQMGAAAFRDEYSQHARLLADAGVDALLPEFLASIDECVEAVDACAETGLPVLLGVRSIQEDGGLKSGETMGDLVSSLKGRDIDAILLMCSRPENITEGLRKLRDAYDGHIGGYANIGYGGVGVLGENARQRYMTLTNYGPARVAEFAREWKEIGAHVIGGCCGTGPEHILMMNLVLKDLERPAAIA